MNEFTPFPSSEDALRDLDDFLPLVWEAMDSGVTGAASFFTEGAPIDSSLFPNLVRYYAKQFFGSRHLVADEEDEVPEFDSIGLANNGLCIVRGRYALRIRKSDNGLIPIPGASYALQQFYRQQPLPFNLASRPAQIVDTSLLVLWQVDPAYRLAGIDLSCPRAGGTTRASVEAHWSIPLVNPMVASTPRPAYAIDDLEGIEAIDDRAGSRRHG